MTKRRPWGVHTLNDMIAPTDVAMGLPDGRYVRAVCEPYHNPITGAWWVLTGRAQAVVWPQPGDLEKIVPDNSAKMRAALRDSLGALWELGAFKSRAEFESDPTVKAIRAALVQP
ncbi:MAG: hypothetical protein EOQ31_31525 [Mesorhizobium sp.]|uniref:hypothetical protein n=1 Tax=Mesorhizobium sp. TaxID=1871066 RepID=UPI000FE95534|nr:hypothetical protein [Mesorhizobium sp.]RWA81477.1 MAG: hypothetical protein EOQ31_31525 [Mesorhizobium sp.]